MSKWTHLICDPCWRQKEGDKIPVRLLTNEVELCCFCGLTTTSGIYVRHNPKEMGCQHSNTD